LRSSSNEIAPSQARARLGGASSVGAAIPASGRSGRRAHPGAPLGERVAIDELLDAGGERLAGEHGARGGTGAAGSVDVALLVDDEAVVGHLCDALDALAAGVPHQLVALGDPIEVEIEQPARLDRAGAPDLDPALLAARGGVGDVDRDEELGVDHRESARACRYRRGEHDLGAAGARRLPTRSANPVRIATWARGRRQHRQAAAPSVARGAEKAGARRGRPPIV
jgi:hypothetical protein